jgi:hypothetical protein
MLKEEARWFLTIIANTRLGKKRHDENEIQNQNVSYAPPWLIVFREYLRVISRSDIEEMWANYF